MRNTLLMIATLGLLSVGFYYYAGATRIERQGSLGGQADLAELTAGLGRSNPDSEMEIEVVNGSMPVAPGKETGFTIFDEFTGKPIQQFQWSTWEKISGTRNDVSVTNPKLKLFTQQLVVTVKAETGKLAVDEVDRRTFRPKKGWLKGDVEISVTRDPDGDETRAAVALDGITIHLDEMYFDLELGQLKADGALKIESPAFGLVGTGLQLVWNDIDRRIDTLEIMQGDTLELALQSGLLAQVRSGPEGEASEETAPTSQPTETGPRRVMTYAVALLDQVEAETWRGDQPTGKLTADELHLLFDMAGQPKQAFENQPGGEAPQPAEEAPAVAAAPQEPVAAEGAAEAEAESEGPALPEKLVVRWKGPLKLAPRLTGRSSPQLRRHIEARGERVRLVGNGSVIECGGLLYREEERRLWLSPRDDAQVTLRMEKGPALDATSIFVDRGAGIVKLVGDVSVRGLSPGSTRDRLRIRSKLWAEMHLAQQAAEDAADAEGLAGATDMPDLTLEKAVFVGGVRADLEGGRSLTAQRLETYFTELVPPAATSQPATSQPLSSQPTLVPPTEVASSQPSSPGGNLQLDKAIASGHVRLQDGKQSLQGTWMKIAFEQGPDGRTFPADLEARGAVGLQNPDENVYARGRRLTARLTRDGRLTNASILGEAAHPAQALAQTYRISGQRLDVTLDEKFGGQQPFHIRVPGQSELLFVSDSGLPGSRQRGNRQPVRITCQQALEFDSDAQRNEIRFLGNVVAQEGGERLEADVLTLFLKDTPLEQVTPTGFARLQALYGQIYARANGQSSDGILSTGASSFRKEPLRLRAQQARLTSETYVPERSNPLMTQQISAPELTVEIPQRTVRTVGRTFLFMQSLRLPQASTPQRNSGAGLGLPSAMISGGPSQTALECKGSMTYVFSDEDQASDSVLFEGGVFFRHVAGKRMLRLQELLPEVTSNPGEYAKLKDRNTVLTCKRLELLLSQAGSAGLPGQGMTLSWLNARGDVRLKDHQGAGIREVNATQIEFDRQAKTVRVLGDKATNQMAVVQYTNPETNRFEQPAAGPAFTIYLDTNTVKAEKVSGSIQR